MRAGLSVSMLLKGCVFIIERSNISFRSSWKIERSTLVSERSHDSSVDYGAGTRTWTSFRKEGSSVHTWQPRVVSKYACSRTSIWTDILEMPVQLSDRKFRAKGSLMNGPHEIETTISCGTLIDEQFARNRSNSFLRTVHRWTVRTKWKNVSCGLFIDEQSEENMVNCVVRTVHRWTVRTK